MHDGEQMTRSSHLSRAIQWILTVVGICMTLSCGPNGPGGGPAGPSPTPTVTPPNGGSPPAEFAFGDFNSYVTVIQFPEFVSVASNAAGTYAVLSATGDPNLEWVGATASGSGGSGVLATTGLFCPDRVSIRPGIDDAFWVSFIAETSDTGCGSNSTAASGLMEVTATGSGNLSAKTPDTSLLPSVMMYWDLGLASDSAGNPFLFGSGDGATSSVQTVSEPGGSEADISGFDPSYIRLGVDVGKVGNPPAAVAAFTIVGGNGDEVKYFLRTSPGAWTDVTSGAPPTLLGERLGVAVWDADNYAVAYPQDNGNARAIKVDIRKAGGSVAGLTIYSDTAMGSYIGNVKLIAAGLSDTGDVTYYAFWVQEDVAAGYYVLETSVSTDGGENWAPATQVNTEDMTFIGWVDAAYNADTKQLHVWWVGDSLNAGNGETVHSIVGSGN